MKFFVRCLIYGLLLPWIAMKAFIVTFLWAFDPQERSWIKTWDYIE